MTTKIFEELWIFTNGGLPILEFSQNEVKDRRMIGAFLTAIKAFSTQFSPKGLQNLTLEKDRVTFISALQDNVMIVCRTNSNVKMKKINAAIVYILKMFEGLYTINDVVTWDGDITFFNEFKERLFNYLES